jgi:hypothetical protein
LVTIGALAMPWRCKLAHQERQRGPEPRHDLLQSIDSLELRCLKA